MILGRKETGRFDGGPKSWKWHPSSLNCTSLTPPLMACQSSLNASKYPEASWSLHQHIESIMCAYKILFCKEEKTVNRRE